MVTVFMVVLAVGLLMLLALGTPAHADTTFTVNSTGDQNDTDFPGGTFDNSSDGKCDVDSGTTGDQCTLRAAIQEANVTTGADTIDFNISGSGVQTISPNSMLPVITEAVTINGYSQPGSSVNTSAKGTNAKLMVELHGTNATAGFGGGLDIEASNVTVKGLVINGFPQVDAIFISPRTTSDVAKNIRIEGNFLGTDPSGTQDVGNGDTGIFIFSGTDNTIGGTSLAARNLISGNDSGGIYIISDSSFGPASNNVVQGNLIGTPRDGTSALGNGIGDGMAVVEVGASAIGNRTLSNSIFSNDGLGIDLADNGVTLNDPDDPNTAQPDPDADTGANGLQNFPDLTSARTSRKGTSIRGTLNSRLGATYTIQFFSNPPGTDEGARLIGQKTSVSVDASGNASFTFKTKKRIGAGQAITATATNEFTGDTSEFSAPVAVKRG
jgi:hypothetical protein